MPVPPETPVISFLSPNKDDQTLTEFFNTSQQKYQPLDLGSSHPNTRDYPGFKLGLQRAVPNNKDWVQRVWVHDESGSSDWFNFSLKFVAEDAACPIFIRTYRERRDTYVPRTKLQPLKAVYKLALANPGSGYTPGTFPAITFSGGAGSGASGYGVVAPDGTIAQVVLGAGGSGFTSNPTATMAAPTSGTTATLTAAIQPATALLVAESADQFPPDSEFYGLYLNVTRVYQTLPGPELTTESIGQDNLTPLKYRRQVTRSISEQDVAATYPMPTDLVGQQTYVEKAKQTIALARLKIITETINVDAAPLLGQETGEWGVQQISELVVPDGTAADEGFFTVKSTVTPFGNGNSAKITISYSSAIVGLVLLTNQGSGYATAPTVSFTGGGGTGATGTAIVSSGKVIRIDMTAVGSGYTSEPTVGFTGGGGTNAAGTAIISLGRLQGQEYVRSYGVIVPFVEYLVASGEAVGIPDAEIEPIDYLRSRLKTIDTTRIAAALSQIRLAMGGTTSLQFPNILDGIRIVFDSTSGDGFSREHGSGQGQGGNWSYEINSIASAEGSASIVPQAVPSIRGIWAHNIRTKRYLLFLPMPVAEADILGALNSVFGLTVTAWPQFNPVEHTIVCTGKRLSVQAKASARVSESVNTSGDSSSAASASSSGQGHSREVGINKSTTHIGQVIHGAIIPVSDIPFDVRFVPTTAEATATASAITVNEKISETLGFGVYPQALEATAGDSAVPTSGLRLLDYPSEPFEFGYAIVHAEVVDFALIPNAAGGSGGGGGTGTPALPVVTYGTPTVSNDTVHLVGTIDPKNADTTYHWELGTTTGYGTTVGGSTTNPIPGATTIIADDAQGAASGLSASTTYHYRLVAVNSAGTTNGADQTFTTKAYPVWFRIFSLNALLKGNEVSDGGLSNDIITLADHTSGYQIGVYADLDNKRFYIYIGNPASPTASAYVTPTTAFGDNYHVMEVTAWSDGTNLFAQFMVDGQLATALNDTAGQHFDRLYAGGKYAARSGTPLLHRFLNNIQLYDYPPGSSAVHTFDGTIDGSVVPPFDSIVGSGVTAAGSGASQLVIDHAGGSENYASKTLPST